MWRRFAVELLHPPGAAADHLTSNTRPRRHCCTLRGKRGIWSSRANLSCRQLAANNYFMARLSYLKLATRPLQLHLQLYFALVLLLIAGFHIGSLFCARLTGHEEFSQSNEIAGADHRKNTIQGRSSALKLIMGQDQDHHHDNIVQQQQRLLDQAPDPESSTHHIMSLQQLTRSNIEESDENHRHRLENSQQQQQQQRRWSRITAAAAAASTRPTADAENYIYLHRKLRASMPLCSMSDLSITQGLSGYSNGIPAYTVQIVNLCMNPRCQLSNIHVACGAFSSARPLDNLVFERLSYNDCYVMNGAPLRAGASVAFEYANSSEYPMHVLSAEVGPCAWPPARRCSRSDQIMYAEFAASTTLTWVTTSVTSA